MITKLRKSEKINNNATKKRMKEKRKISLLQHMKIKRRRDEKYCNAKNDNKPDIMKRSMGEKKTSGF